MIRLPKHSRFVQSFVSRSIFQVREFLSDNKAEFMKAVVLWVPLSLISLSLYWNETAKAKHLEVWSKIELRRPEKIDTYFREVFKDRYYSTKIVFIDCYLIKLASGVKESEFFDKLSEIHKLDGTSELGITRKITDAFLSEDCRISFSQTGAGLIGGSVIILIFTFLASYLVILGFEIEKRQPDRRNKSAE